jgi:putative ABC transport system permease protein
MSAALRLYRLALKLVPSYVRERGEGELVEMVRARLEESDTRVARMHVLLREIVSVIGLAARVRGGGPFPENSRLTKDLPLMDQLWQDVRFALRSFARRPAFTLLLVATFGLGIAAATSMFTVVDAVLLKPLSFDEPEELLSIYPTLPEWRDHPTLSSHWQTGRFSYPELIEYAGQQRAFESVGGYSGGSATIRENGPPEQIGIGVASPGLFRTLRVRALHGRVLSDSDRSDAIVLTHKLFTSRFGGDAGIVGRSVRLGSEVTTVVGVLPASFALPESSALLWRLADATNQQNQNDSNHMYRAVGRLRDGVTQARASEEAERLIAAFSVGDHIGHGGRTVSPTSELTRSYHLPLSILMAASLVLLLAACTSVATMLLGAGLDRQQELAIRSAMGARRSRVLAQLTTEGMLLGVIGGACGVLLSRAVLQFLLRLAPAETPRLDFATIDYRVLAFAVTLSLAFAALFTVGPAMLFSRVGFGASGSGARIVAGRSRLQSTLVAAEIALATLLLVGAGLLTRTVLHLQERDPGFNPDNLVAITVGYDFNRFEPSRDGFEDRLNAWFTTIVDAVRTVPGAEAVALARVLPFSGDQMTTSIEPEGYTPADGEIIDAGYRGVSWNYIDAMQLRVVAGRSFTSADALAGAGVTVVNELLAQRYFGGAAVGRRLRVSDEEYVIIGVIANAGDQDLRGEDTPKFYIPDAANGSIIVRHRGDADAMMSALRAQVWSADPSVPITRLSTMREFMAGTLGQQLYRMRLMLTFAALATLFAVMGVYGVMSRAAARRSREMGIRSAVGAARGDLLRLMLGHGARISVAGVVIGIAAAAVATRVLESMLFETERNDPATLLSIVALMLTLGVLAAWAPARRAAAVQPMEVLRADY